MALKEVIRPRWQAALAAALCARQSLGNSIFLATLCAGETCNDASHPLIDYDEDEERCVCRAHPCWDDNGRVHSCKDKPDFSYLSFRYTDEKDLVCECSSIPQYSSVHIAHDLCSGHMCDKPDFPVLDFDAEQQQCLCRAHPCWNDNGLRHSCDKPDFPILRYRKDKDYGTERDVCECQISMEKTTDLPVMGSSAPGADPNEADFLDEDDEAVDDEDEF
mmetsp:Transcript_78041/g.137511  ORF Transcript_78041/g.137511 Transcript_78041/m.137511 type:complete len:219 (+) Transcript_78041:57-713(+)